MLVHVGGGEDWGRTTGANALFCFTAETMFAGEKEKIPEELLQFEGRLVEEAMVGLEGTTAGMQRAGLRNIFWIQQKDKQGRDKLGNKKYCGKDISCN